MLAGHRFEHMCFVEDDRIIIRKDADIRHAECQVREEKGMVGNDQLGILEPASCGIIETAFMRGAVSAHAVSAVADHFIPNPTQRFE